MKRLKVPQYLHRPYQVLFFEVDELAALLLMLVLALFFGGIFWLFMIPFALFLSYAKKKFPRGYLKHLFYVIGFVSFKGTPSYFAQKFEE